MKHIFYIVLLMPTLLFAQVGINTTQPTKTLDVNGQQRIRVRPQGTTSDSLLVSDNLGNVRRLHINQLQQSNTITCPQLVRQDSNGHYLKFVSTSSIPNPTSPLIISGRTFNSAGTWIDTNGIYYFTYTNVSGNPLNINQTFSVSFGTTTCIYTP